MIPGVSYAGTHGCCVSMSMTALFPAKVVVTQKSSPDSGSYNISVLPLIMLGGVAVVFVFHVELSTPASIN